MKLINNIKTEKHSDNISEKDVYKKNKTNL